jgi:hypothetical protein
MDWQTNERFGEEFVKILDRTYFIITKHMMESEGDQNNKDDEFWN